MQATNRTAHYGFPQWTGNDHLKREDMNEAFAIADNQLYRVEAEDVLRSFDRLSMQKGYHTTNTLTTQNGFDTWTSVITDANNNEVARKVEVESSNQSSGWRTIWTSTVTIGDKVVTIVDTETADGWVREVR